jgi:cupin 2 domain-containing protein
MLVKNNLKQSGNFLTEAQFPSDKTSPEIFHRLYDTDNLIIERITSNGQTTANDEWLEENFNEWVLLLQGESKIKFDTGEEYNIREGDYLFIPANIKHRVEYTSLKPECIWLAIHFK